MTVSFRSRWVYGSKWIEKEQRENSIRCDRYTFSIRREKSNEIRINRKTEKTKKLNRVYIAFDERNEERCQCYDQNRSKKTPSACRWKWKPNTDVKWHAICVCDSILFASNWKLKHTSTHSLNDGIGKIIFYLFTRIWFVSCSLISSQRIEETTWKIWIFHSTKCRKQLTLSTMIVRLLHIDWIPMMLSFDAVSPSLRSTLLENIAQLISCELLIWKWLKENADRNACDTFWFLLDSSYVHAWEIDARTIDTLSWPAAISETHFNVSIVSNFLCWASMWREHLRRWIDFGTSSESENDKWF